MKISFIKYKTIYLIIISLLIIFINIEAKADKNNIKITSQTNEILPKYNINYKYYYIKGCVKKNNKISIIKNNNIINTHYINLSETKTIKVNNKNIRIKCTPDYFKFFDYKFNNFENKKGYYFFDISSVTVIYNTDGYPVWYRDYENYLPYYTNINNKGVITTVLYDRKTLKEHKVAINNLKTNAYVLKYDIVKDKIIKIITPYEIINGEKKYPPIDYHGFHESKTGYYFISYEDTIEEKITKKFIVNFKNINQKDINICNSFNKDILIRKPRIIKTDKSGLVKWSKTISTDNNYAPTIFINKNLADFPCIIDINHPNYISANIDESKITVGLRNNYIIIYDKELNIYKILSNSKTKEENIEKIISNKFLDTKLDPLNGICGSHGGSINNKNELLVYDNRCNKNEASRAVIYNINEKDNTATMKKFFNLAADKCFKAENGQINCNAESQGNAEFGSDGEIIINWGVIEGNNNILSVYDKNYKKILEVIENKNDIIPNIYNIKYINKDDTVDLEANIKYSMSIEKNKKNNKILDQQVMLLTGK